MVLYDWYDSGINMNDTYLTVEDSSIEYRSIVDLPGALRRAFHEIGVRRWFDLQNSRTERDVQQSLIVGLDPIQQQTYFQ